MDTQVQTLEIKTNPALPFGTPNVRHHLAHPDESENVLRVTTVSSPLVINGYSYLRNRLTNREQFVRHTKIITTMLVPYALTDVEYEAKMVETPLMENGEYKKTIVYQIRSRIVLIAVLRAGIIMADVFDEFLPGQCIIGHVGIHRVPENEAEPEIYCNKIPKLRKDDVVIIPDPMLAKGGTICEGIRMAIEAGADPNRITTVHLVAAPFGIKRINAEHPGTKVVAGAVDRELNSAYYICGEGLTPENGGEGLGDAGAREYGTDH